MNSHNKQKPVSAAALRRLPSSLRQACGGIFLNIAVLAGSAGALWLAAPGPARAAQPRQAFDIPAMPLGEALQRFAVQSGRQVLYTESAAAGFTSQPIAGEMAAGDALRRLIGQAPLQMTESEGVFSLAPAPQQQGATLLESVPVVGRYDFSVTEGTGAYTTDWMKTATGLGLAQRDTPQSVSAITRAQIEDRNMTTMRDMMENATGITVNQTETDRLNFYSRGFEIDSYQYDGVPTVLDSTYQYGDGELDTAIYDHVEIVRGATGLMTGAGEPGASINLVRKRPLREFGGQVALTAGTQDNFRGEFDISLPLTDDGRIRTRLVGAAQRRGDTLDGYRHERNVIYGVIEADLTRDTVATVGVNRQQNRSRGTTWAGMPAFDDEGNVIDWPKGSTTGADWTGWDTTSVEMFGSVEHRFANDWKGRVSLNRLTNDFKAPLLYISGFPDMQTGLGTTAYATRYRGNRDQNSVAASLNGGFAAFGRRHEFVAGVFNANTSGDITERTAAGTMPEVGDIFRWDGSYPEPQWNEAPSNRTNSHTRQTGLYGTLRLRATDALSVIGGARVNEWHGRLDSYYSGYDYKHEGIVTPYLGVTYDLDDTYTAYASYTNIYKPQTYQDAEGKNLDPAYGHNYEAGIKGSYLDGRLNASLAFFLTNQKNVAEYVDYDPVAARSIYRSIDGTTTRGFEIEVAGEVTPSWNVFAGFTYRNAKDDEGNPVNTFQPRSTLKAGTAYRLPGALSRLTVGGGLRWQSRTENLGYWMDDDSRSIVQRPYAVADLMARYEFTPQLSLALNVNNVFDKRYFRTMGFYNSVYYGDGRTATVTLRALF